MSLDINYFRCEFSNYDESYNSETGEETRYYNCTHPDGHGTCDLPNKFNGSTATCDLLEEEQNQD